MKKPTRLQILIRSFSFSVATTIFFATLLQTAGKNEFPQFRESLSDRLADFFPFWTFFFFLLVLFTGYVLFAFYHYANTKSDWIFSEDGVLLFDREQHIAISVPTIKKILLSISEGKDKTNVADRLYNTGVQAGLRFGAEFSEIYERQSEGLTTKPWSQLTDNEKLDAWEQYDSTVGWGKIRAHKYQKKRVVTVNFQHPSLYNDKGGELFSWLLAGYSQKIVSSLIGCTANFDSETGFLHDAGLLELTYTY